jgi:hypothetical protein
MRNWKCGRYTLEFKQEALYRRSSAAVADPRAVPALRVSISGFHQRVFSRSEIAHRRYLSEEALVAQIRAVYEEHLGTYGWPRIWRQLRKSGTRVG